MKRDFVDMAADDIDSPSNNAESSTSSGTVVPDEALPVRCGK